MKKLILCTLVLVVFACKTTTEKIHDILTSEDFLKWNKDQPITFDLFQGEGPENAYSMWVGIYLIYDFDLPEFRFNVTTFMDKTKSYVAEPSELTDKEKVAFFPMMYKLKFDHYEIYARKLRQFITENKNSFSFDSRDELEALNSKYYQEAENSWQAITDDLENNNGFNEEKFSYLRFKIDAELNDLKMFDQSVNNY
jgi:hypothetical protein